MKTIWKYPLEVIESQFITMPVNAEMLTVQKQGNDLCLWARVDPEAPKVMREIITHGTGHPVPDTTGRYIGTYQLAEGKMVFHVFEAAKRD